MTETENVVRYMKRHGLKLATAESCTAGLIASRLAEIPGAGALLECAFVVYSTEAKRHCLGVPAEVLQRYNLTSTEVASAMARGAAERVQANVIVANTGVADEGGNGVPAGTQCFAWLLRDLGAGGESALFSETRHFSGGRNAVRSFAADYAIMRIMHYHDHWRTGRI